LEAFEDIALSRAGLKMMHRHSWYLSPELATLAIFSDLLSANEKAHIVLTLTNERGSHLLKSLPKTVADLNGSRTFFETAGIDDSFLDIPIDIWPSTNSYIEADHMIKNLACINDSAGRGVALIQTFNAATIDEEQLQYLLQVVEQHRAAFPKCDREYLITI